MSKIRTTIYLDSDTREAIRQLEYQDKQSMAAIVIEAITHYLRRPELCTKEKKTILSK